MGGMVWDSEPGSGLWALRLITCGVSHLRQDDLSLRLILPGDEKTKKQSRITKKIRCIRKGKKKNKNTAKEKAKTREKNIGNQSPWLA